MVDPNASKTYRIRWHHERHQVRFEGLYSGPAALVHLRRLQKLQRIYGIEVAEVHHVPGAGWLEVDP